MTTDKVYTVIGLMSGTSLDGIDAALIRTNGIDVVEPIDYVEVPYEAADRRTIRACFGQTDRTREDVKQAEVLSTTLHIQAAEVLLKKSGFRAADVDLIGYHGQTIRHAPKENISIQIGDGALMAQQTGIDIVNDFRSKDVAAGGQGAPLIPLYHRAITRSQKKPVAVVNIGGVANVTYIGGDEGVDMLAFDTGTGSAMIDDVVARNTNQKYDRDGIIAARGTIAQEYLKAWTERPFFSRQPPKSLDRDSWRISGDVNCLPFEDAVATLTAFTVQGIVKAKEYMPQEPLVWYICGGGRHNKTMMAWLREYLQNVEPVEILGYDGDAIEAQGFAYYAVRSILGRPITYPKTTNVAKPLTGGTYYPAKAQGLKQKA